MELVAIFKTIRMHFTSKRCYSRIRIRLEIAITLDPCKRAWMSWRMLGIPNSPKRCSLLCLQVLDILDRMDLRHLLLLVISTSPLYYHRTENKQNKMPKIDIKKLEEFTTLITSNKIISRHTCNNSKCKQSKTTITLPAPTFKFSNLTQPISIL